MSTRAYTVPLEETRWSVASPSTTIFNWEYDEGREKLLNLYEKGKKLQWNSNERIDWSAELDFSQPLNGDDSYVAIYGSPTWLRLNDAEKAQVRQNSIGWTFSTSTTGLATARGTDVRTVVTGSYSNGTPVEFRWDAHLRKYVRYIGGVNKHLKALLDDVIADSRWDMTYLGMQVLIEGLALAAFGLIRDVTDDPMARSLVAYVMQDEARHVAFGRLALRDYYPQLTIREREDREEFCVQACYLMRDRFLAEEVWANLGFDVDECLTFVRNSESQKMFRSLLFTRIVPMLKDIGLWGPRIHNAFADMGVMGFESIDLDTVMAQDEQQAETIDEERRRQVDDTITAGAA